MNSKTTLLVCLVALLLGAYVLVFETDMFDRQLASTREIERAAAENTAQAGQPLLKPDALPVEQVRRVTIALADEKPFVIERDADKPEQWRQIEPVKFELQGYRVTDLINAAAGLRQTAAVKPGDNGLTLAKLGLAPPRGVVTLTGDDMQPVTLSLGARSGAGRAYIALGDPDAISTVAIVDDRLHESLLNEPLRDMRSRSLASFPAGSVRGVTLKSENQTLKLARSDGRWTLVEPVTGRADRAAAEALAATISSAMIDAFVQDQPPSLAMFGLDQPSRVLTVETVDAAAGEQAPEKIKTHKLAIGAPQDLEQTKFFAMYNDIPAVFTLRKTEVDRLAKRVDDLRDPSLTPVTSTDVKAIELHRPAGKLSFVRDQGAWTFGEPKPAFKLDGERIDDLLNAIFQTKATGYTGAPAGEAKLTVVLNTGGQTPETLRVFEADGKTIVVRNDEPTGYVVSGDALSLLSAEALAFRDRTVLDLAADEIAELRIARSGSHPAEYHLKRGDGGAWAFGNLDEQKLRKVLEHLTPLRAEQWIADKPQASAETATVTITTTGGPEHVLTVHVDTRHATVSGQDQAIMAPSALAELLAAELRDTAVLKLPLEQIASVTTGSVTVERTSDGNYRLIGDGQIDEAKAAGIFDTLAGLKAQRFVGADRAGGEPSATLRITTNEGTSHTLAVWLPAEGDAVARLGETTFTLGRQAAQKLAATPLK